MRPLCARVRVCEASERERKAGEGRSTCRTSLGATQKSKWRKVCLQDRCLPRERERLLSDLDMQRISASQAKERNQTVLQIRCGADKAQGRNFLDEAMNTFIYLFCFSNFSRWYQGTINTLILSTICLAASQRNYI